MQINRASLRALETGYRSLYQGAFDTYTPEYPSFSMVTSSDAESEVYTWLSSSPSMRAFRGEADIASLSGSLWTVKNEAWHNTIGVPREAIERDKFGGYNLKFQEMGQKASWHPDRLCATLLANAFTANDYTGSTFIADSKKHVKGSKATFDNKIVYKLAQSSFEIAKAMLVGLKDSEGDPFSPKPKLLLVVPPDLDYLARQVVKAATIATGGTNVSSGLAEILCFPYLTDPNAWFLMNIGSVVKPIIVQKEVPIEFTAQTDPDSDRAFFHKEYAYQTYGRYTANYGLPQLVVGSTGASAAP